MGSHLQLSGQWTAGGATTGMKHHVGGHAIISHHVGLKSDQILYSQVNTNRIFFKGFDVGYERQKGVTGSAITVA